VNQFTTYSGSLYAGTDRGLFRSGDNGAHWVQMSTMDVVHMAFDPNDANTIYVVHYNSANTLAKTTDGGVTWQELYPDSSGPPVSAVAVDPTNPSTVYAAGDRVYRSDDGGATWTRSDVLPGSSASSLAVDPTNSDILYVATSPSYLGGGITPSIPAGAAVLRSSDAGRTFQQTPGPARALNIVADPVNAGTLYVAGSGIFKSSDFGAHWTLLDSSRLNSYQSLAFDTSGGLLAIATDGRLSRTTDGGASVTPASDFPVYGPNTIAVTDDGVIHIGAMRGGSAIAMKLDYSGNVNYATYWGGHLSEAATGIALDADGNVYVAGYGTSPDFPEVNAARLYSGATDAFVFKLDPAGRIVYSTSWGGVFDDFAYSVAAGQSGAVYFTGTTSSVDFPAAQRGQIFLVGLQ
jgi:photosystem II stability/assembly factor-like uncharacterized protein